MSALQNLALGDLQSELGSTLLAQIEELLPTVDPATDPATLYTSKKTLERIFIAFGGAERLANPVFRRLLLDRFPASTLAHLATELGLDSSAPFDQTVSAIVSLGWANEATCATILTALQLDPALAPKAQPKYPAYAKAEHGAIPYKPLKDFQSEIFFEAEDKLSSPLSRFVIQMPTGAGKTRTAVEIICEHLNKEGGTVVWLAHSEELCEQARQAFQETWLHVGRRELGIARVYGTQKEIPTVTHSSAFVVASFQRLYALLRRLGKDALASRFGNIGLVVVDEAHKVVAATYNEVTRSLFGKATKCIGLTATPGRSAVNLDENKELAAFFFEKIITFDSRGQDPISYLRKKRVLSQAAYVPLLTNLNFELSAKEREHLEQFYDLPKGVLQRIGSSSVRNAEIVKRIQDEARNGARILFFGCSVEHSKFISAMLSFLKISAAHIDGTTPRERRTRSIEQYRSGNIQVLCNYEVLATGFDAPKTDVVFISRPTASVVLYSQMIGRGLRGPAVGGTESCRIIDVKDNIRGFSDQASVYSYFEDYWQRTVA